MADPAQMAGYREAMRKEWVDDKIVAAWRKWHPAIAAWTRPLTEAMLQAAEFRPGLDVLDLASGSGEPALSIAAAVAPEGCVTATDLSRGMLAVAEENAHRQGISNISFREADAEALPFPDKSFHCVTCRCGVMFVPDPVQAFRECRRVLKPGGRGVFLVWGPREQAFFTMTVGVLKRFVEVPTPPPDAPNVFRFAEPETLRAAMAEAGFARVQAEPRTISTVWPGTPERFWEWFQELAAPFRPIIEGLPPLLRHRVDELVLAEAGKYFDGRELRFPARIVLAAGTRE